MPYPLKKWIISMRWMITPIVCKIPGFIGVKVSTSVSRQNQLATPAKILE